MPHLHGTTAERIRYGLTGLAVAFLIVLIGSVISRSGQGGLPPTAEENAQSNEPNEPLAELGVAPGNADANAVAPNAAPPVAAPGQR